MEAGTGELGRKGRKKRAIKKRMAMAMAMAMVEEQSKRREV